MHVLCNGVRWPSYHGHHYLKRVSAVTTLDNTMTYFYYGGRGVGLTLPPTPILCAEVLERVELYLYSP